jgi:hypothetical protein
MLHRVLDRPVLSVAIVISHEGDKRVPVGMDCGPVGDDAFQVYATGAQGKARWAQRLTVGVAAPAWDRVLQVFIIGVTPPGGMPR